MNIHQATYDLMKLKKSEKTEYSRHYLIDLYKKMNQAQCYSLESISTLEKMQARYYKKRWQNFGPELADNYFANRIPVNPIWAEFPATDGEDHYTFAVLATELDDFLLMTPFYHTHISLFKREGWIPSPYIHVCRIDGLPIQWEESMKLIEEMDIHDIVQPVGSYKPRSLVSITYTPIDELLKDYDFVQYVNHRDRSPLSIFNMFLAAHNCKAFNCEIQKVTRNEKRKVRRNNILPKLEFRVLKFKTRKVIKKYTPVDGDPCWVNRLHSCEGHPRRYKSGKRAWVADMSRGDITKGVIIKTDRHYDRTVISEIARNTPGAGEVTYRRANPTA